MSERRTVTSTMFSEYTASAKKTISTLSNPSALRGPEKLASHVENAFIKSGVAIGYLTLGIAAPFTSLYDTFTDKRSFVRQYSREMADQFTAVWQDKEKTVDEKIQNTAVGVVLHALASIPVFAISAISDPITLNFPTESIKAKKKS